GFFAAFRRSVRWAFVSLITAVFSGSTPPPKTNRGIGILPAKAAGAAALHNKKPITGPYFPDDGFDLQGHE
ncbi:MAG: hypothetical protein ACRD19_07050, partial [Terriglobia bacterium]